MMAEMAAQSVSLPPGLSSAEARRRLQQIGSNRFIRERHGARLLAFARMFADPMAAMLLAAAAVYFALGERIEGLVLLAPWCRCSQLT